MLPFPTACPGLQPGARTYVVGFHSIASPKRSLCSILSCREQQRGYVLLRSIFDTLVTPHLSPVGGTPVSGVLEFTLTQLTTTASTFLVLRTRVLPKNAPTTIAFILRHHGT